MPKIPLVQRQVGEAAGSLGPRASSGAFTAPGQAAASFAKEVGNVVTTFAQMEGREEDRRVAREEYAQAYNIASEHVFNDKSTNTTDAGASFDALEQDLFSKIDGKGYSKRRANIVKDNMSKMLLQQRFNAKNEAFKRGHFQAGVAAAGDVSSLMEMAGQHPVGSPMYNFLTDEAKKMVKVDETKGYTVKAYPYTTNTLAKDLDKLEKDGLRKQIQSQIRNATSVEDLKRIEKNVQSETRFEAPDQAVLFSQIDNMETELGNNQIAAVASHIDVDNIGADDFSTVEAEEAKLAKARNGDFGANLDAQAIWDSSDNATRKKMVTAMEDNLAAARRTLTFKQGQADRKITESNDQIFSDKIESVRKGDMSLEQIDALEFQGEGGEKLRQQMRTAAINSMTGAPVTSSNFRIDNAINQKVMRNEISSVTQKFTLPGETKPLSILERENFQITSARVDEYFRMFKVDERNETRRRESKINDFLRSKELRVRGSSLLVKNPTPDSDERMEIFSSQTRELVKKGLDAGKNFDDLLNINHPDYIMPNDVIRGFVPSKQTLLNEAKSLFAAEDNISGFTIDQVKPPTLAEMGLPNNASLSQVENHPLYRAWEQSFKGFVYQELTAQQQ